MAAKQPDLSPSIVSESITTLEQNAGVPLSIRTTCSVTPTEAGRTLADLLPLC
ncbi:LysR family transcriptional regulator [Pantoea brenneri]|nr:LysR family transcriptional regulator [Pantoea brenneri]